MSDGTVIRWLLGIGLVLMAVAVGCSLLDLIPASVITGLLGLISIGIAGYGALDTWASRAQERRRAAKNRR